MPDSWWESKSARTPGLFVNFPTRIGGLFGPFMSVSEDIVEQVASECFQETRLRLSCRTEHRSR